MRVSSAGMIKGQSSAKLTIPTEGTLKRFVYDYFYSMRGLEIPPQDYLDLQDITRGSSGKSGFGTILRDLKDYWGLDIRKLGKSRYILVGEWCGRIYIDYTGPAEARASRPQENAA